MSPFLSGWENITITNDLQGIPRVAPLRASRVRKLKLSQREIPIRTRVQIFPRCTHATEALPARRLARQYEHGIEFNLAASTGPSWTVNEHARAGRRGIAPRFLNHKLVYGRPAGADSLREAIAEMQGVTVDCVQIVTGASEALTILMWLAAEPGANVILPLPGFTTFSALPESLGLETALLPRAPGKQFPNRRGRNQASRRF